MKRYLWIALLILTIIVSTVTIVGCSWGHSQTDEQREQSVAQRTTNMARAEALYPAPDNQNFPLRALLIEYTRRQDLINHPWYTYIMSDTGSITHYFVSTTMPVSTNAFLGSTEVVWSSDQKSEVLTAPSLDGIYCDYSVS